MAHRATLRALLYGTQKASRAMAFTVRSILPTHTGKADFNGDGLTDLIWHGADGTLAVWNMSADGLTGRSGLFVPSPAGDLVLRGYGDLTADGTTDLIWQSQAGAIQTWTVRDNQVTAITQLGTAPPVQATGDFDGNGHVDLLWFNAPVQAPGLADGVWTAATAEARKIPPIGLGTIPPFSIDFGFVGPGDFNGDGRDGALFRGTGNATVGTFLVQEPTGVASNNGQMPTQPITFRDPGASWSVLGLADFNGDGRTDILWQHSGSTGEADARSIWLMDGGTVIGGGMVANPGADWSVIATGDYDNDGRADLMWHHGPTGWNSEWLMEGADVKAFGASIANPGDFWTLGAA